LWPRPAQPFGQTDDVNANEARQLDLPSLSGVTAWGSGVNRMGWMAPFALTFYALLLAIASAFLGGWAEKQLGDRAEYRLEALLPHAASLLLFFVTAVLALASLVDVFIQAL